MEQTISAYRCESPYRRRVNEERKKQSKFFSKFLRQTIVSMIIFMFFFWCQKIEFIRTSNIWQKMVYAMGYNIEIDEVKETFAGVVSYIQEKAPEYFNNPKSYISKEENKEIDFEKMKEDAENIKLATTVLRPVPGSATSRFGKRINVITGKEEIHGGVDLEAEIGTPVRAAIQGTVIEIKEIKDSFGKFIRIKNADIITTYAHCSEITVEQGSRIEQGEVIAYSGNTGNTTGPHLHFEILKDGRYVDPGLVMSQ